MSSNKNVNIIINNNDLNEEGGEDVATKSISLEQSNSKDDNNVFSSDDDRQQNKIRDSKIVDDAKVDDINYKNIPLAISMDDFHKAIFKTIEQHIIDDSNNSSAGRTINDKSLISFNTITNGFQSDNADDADTYFNDGADQENYGDDRDVVAKSLDIKNYENQSASNEIKNSFMFTDDTYADDSFTELFYIEEKETDPTMTIDFNAVISQQEIISMYKKFYDDQKAKRIVKATIIVSNEDESSCHRKTNDCVCKYDQRVISSFQYENGNSRCCIPLFLRNFNFISKGIILTIDLEGANTYNLSVILNGVLYKAIFNINIIHPYVKNKITLTDFMHELYAPILQQNPDKNGKKEIYEIDMKKLQELFLAPSDAQIKVENKCQRAQAKQTDNENQIKQILNVKLTDGELSKPQQVDEKQPTDQIVENKVKYGKQNKKRFNSCNVSTSTPQTTRKNNHLDYTAYMQKLMQRM